MKQYNSYVTVRYRPQRRLVFDNVAQCSGINSSLDAHFFWTAGESGKARKRIIAVSSPS